MKSLLFIFFIFISIKVTAPDQDAIFIYRPVPVDAYERLINAVIQVECGGNFMAFNLKEKAAGPFQIRPVRLRDYNLRTGNNRTLEECYNLEVSKEIFLYYARRTGYPHYELIARNWNGSGNMTLQYWKKVKALL